MSLNTQLDQIILELRGVRPLSVHVNGTVNYVVYGSQTIGGVTGYPILRVTEPSVSQVYLDNGFLLEELRVSGSNGSDSLVNIKTDLVNSILLLSDPLLTYG